MLAASWRAVALARCFGHDLFDLDDLVTESLAAWPQAIGASKPGKVPRLASVML